MKLYIKNMVCNRCKMVVESELEKLGLHPVEVELGEVEIKEDSIDDLKKELVDRLQLLGFEFLDDKKSITVEKIKTFIVDLVHYQNNKLTMNLSDLLSEHLAQDYNTLSKLFSEEEGTTIEKYFIHQKIEKVKELIMYDEMNLNEITHQLNYSSVSHLSNQFKKVTGYSPSQFKQLKDKKRKQLDDL